MPGRIQMENAQGGVMRISWVLANDTMLDPHVDVERMKSVGSFWGSWQTWRAYSTDNVICSDLARTQELLKRQFYKHCNLYVSRANWAMSDRPEGVRLFEGEFRQEVIKADEIISMQLAASQSDLVLLLGFDWAKRQALPDKLAQHQRQVYMHMAKHAIADTSIQWVLIDHAPELDPAFANLPNLTQDNLSSVFDMLGT